MSIEITDLTALDPAVVQQALAETVQRIQEAHPTLDLKRGVLHDIVALLHAELAAGQQQNVDRYLSARSVLDIMADPSLADEGVVEGVLSNWGLKRGEAAAAVGEVTIVLSAPTSVTIGSGAIFTVDGKVYTSDAAYTAKVEPELVTGVDDRLLTQLSDGNWGFTIHVTAQEPGTAGIITKDTLLVPAALPTNYVTSFATGDFTGGLDPETNDQLLDKLLQGIAAKAPSNRTNMKAMLREQSAFAGVINSSIVGFGHADMIRDQHTIWPGSLGGKADWYVRTTERAVATAVSKTATLVTKNTDGSGLWQIEFGREEFPGFYEIASIRRPAADVTGTFTITEDVRGVDLSGDTFVPDIVLAEEGAYSRFQTAVIRFTDDETNYSALTVGDTQAYDVAVRGLPQIAEIQDYVSSPDIRSYGADVLIKAPVPCFLQLSFTINKKHTQEDPDVSAIADALARAVNRVDFVGRLSGGQLQDVIYGFLPEGMSASNVDMFGRLRWPDGTIKYLRSSELLLVEEVDGAMVSPRTVQFFLEPDAVTIDVRTDVPVPT